VSRMLYQTPIRVADALPNSHPESDPQLPEQRPHKQHGEEEHHQKSSQLIEQWDAV
jgi:hypothetical protein